MDGILNCFHLPLFTNIELFIYCIKMHFCQKYYGENDYSKVTPEMINLKFISTSSTLTKLSLAKTSYKTLITLSLASGVVE